MTKSKSQPQMKFNVQLRLVMSAILFLILSIPAVAQLNVGSASPPNTSAMLQVSSNNNKGFLLSQVALVSTSSPLPLTAHVAGMMVYNTATSGSGSTAVTPGIYTNDGTRWSLISMQSGTSPATFTGSTLTCAGTQSGTYQAGIAMTGSNTQVATITLATTGSYIVTTTTVNGVSFYASGTALSTGATNFTLTASGTPSALGTFAYPISFGGQNCSFNVTYSGNTTSGGSAIISATTCGSAVVTGTLTNGVAASGVTVSIPVNTTTAGTYAIATTAVSGITWSGSGTLTAGSGNIVLTASGTPSTTGAISYPLNTSPTCSFSATNAVSPSSGGSAIVSAWNCAGTDAGSLQVGIAASGVTHAITATVTTLGTYSVTTTTNGITYAGSGTFAGTGSQIITLTASGTPTTSGSNSFTTSAAPTCSFTRAVATAATFTCGAATTVQSPTGALVNGTVYTGSYTIPYTVGNGTSYGTTNQTVNGLTLTRVAGTYAAGGGNVVYNLTGTAGAAVTAVFTIPECTSVTFGFLSPTSGGTGVTSAWNCTGTDAGSLQVGVAASGVTHAITATVTTVGTYNVTASTNGVTYTGTGTFAGTGSQTITLTASGIPTTQGSNSFTTSATTACSFTETVASAATFACASATTVLSPAGQLVNGTVYTGSYTIAYTAGNGTTYGTTTQTVNGLTLTRSAGTFASGGGNVIYNLTGNAGAAASATFTIAECTLATFGCANDITVGTGAIVQMMYDNTGSGTASYSWCARTVVGPDGLTWLDRNLGAQRVATSVADYSSFGSLYQWGRNKDGHQRIGGYGVDNATSNITGTLATTNTPANKLFIWVDETSNGYDWRSDNNSNRWNNVTGSGAGLVQENNPCPGGYHVPTNAQQITVATEWMNGTDAFSSTLRLPFAGIRYQIDGSLGNAESYGYYWSATAFNINGHNLMFTFSGDITKDNSPRALGMSVRCIKN